MYDIKRKYQETHSWINFNLDLTNAPFSLWLLLGAAESKCKHLAGIPLRPEKQNELNQISLIKGVHATTAIEGNTLSEEDVSKIFALDDNLPKSQGYQKQEIQNMLDAYNSIAQDIQKNKICDISVQAILNDNFLILRNLELKDEIIPGDIRTYPVHVKNYRGAPAEDCDFLLHKLISWLNSDWHLQNEHPIVEGILKAIVGHVYIAWIHPFGDGNGRAARLFEFRLLLNAGIPLTAAHLLTSYYNETRNQYSMRLGTSSLKKYGLIEFIEYSVQGFVDALDSQIKTILDEQLNITWENYIHKTCFGGKLTPALRRRRDLLLEISALISPLHVNELKLRISQDTLKLYQGKTRALVRDINYLENKGLLYKTDTGYLAAKDKMKAFLPLQTGEILS